jgi:hypothetical protein
MFETIFHYSQRLMTVFLHTTFQFVKLSTFVIFTIAM